MKQLKGVYTALITPFKEDGELDEEGLDQLIQRQKDAGVNGIVVLGTTGETPNLSEPEKETIITKAVKCKSELFSVIVGTGSYSTAQTIRNTLLAQELGADGALVVTPFYVRPTQGGLYAHYKAIAHVTDLPIIAYNVKGRTGQDLTVETVVRLLGLPSLIGIKEASGDIEQMIDIIEKTKKKRANFAVLTGNDSTTLPSIALGGDGVISVASNVVPKEIVSLVNESMSGDFEKARVIHQKLYPLIRSLFLESNPIPVKAALQHLGLPAGSCRLPLTDLSEKWRPILHEALDQVISSQLIR